MSRPAIVYLHGFRSSPASVKATLLAAAVAALPARERPALDIPALHAGPADAVEQASRLVLARASEGPVTIVGSSLGGHYATYLAERHGTRAVLVNPAVRPWEDLAPYLGRQTNLHTGDAFEVTPAHFGELRALEVAAITRPDRYFLMVETGDEVLDYRRAIAHYAGAFQYVRGGGDHAFGDFACQIPAILRFADPPGGPGRRPGGPGAI